MSQPRYNPRTRRDDWYYRIKEEHLVDVNTVKHTDVRDVDAEWICLQKEGQQR